MTGSEPGASFPDATVAESLLLLKMENSEEVPVRVSGLSMGVTLGRSSEVLVRSFSPPPNPGDVILLRLDGQLVVHRVIELIPDRRQVVTKGDNCRRADAPTAYEDVLGLVTGIRKEAGTSTPPHWRPPLSRGIALLSRSEARGGLPFSPVFWNTLSWSRRIHRKWCKIRKKPFSETCTGRGDEG